MAKVLTNKRGYYSDGSYEFSKPEKTGEGGIRRCSLVKDGDLVQYPVDGVKTVYEIVEYAARTHGSRPAVGWRDVVDTIEEEKEVTKVVEGKEVKEKKKWKYFELSPYKYLTFIEVKEAVSEVARGLLHLGVTDKDVFNIYAQTRYVAGCGCCGSAR
ncbi:hypothetical protein H1R20_g705, partial [Candolleomyces eurysporus]